VSWLYGICAGSSLLFAVTESDVRIQIAGVLIGAGNLVALWLSRNTQW
jgi:hypothetical protein